MRILLLSDLHMCSRFNDYPYQVKQLRDIVDCEYPDVVVITGDIFETFHDDPYYELSEIFPTLPVVCTLGNHEFFDRSVEKTLNFYRDICEDKYNVHYLDICGHFDFSVGDVNVRFVGNVLWYDGSMRSYPTQDMYDFAGGRWRDADIVDFDYERENRLCREQIEKNRSTLLGVIHVLCTHTVPHVSLNAWYDNASDYNAYCGCTNYLETLPWVDFAVCGHTHKRVIGQKIGRCYGFNVGSDYFHRGDIIYYLLEINQLSPDFHKSCNP